MKIVFVGTVEGSRIALEAIIQADFPPVLVITLSPTLALRHSDYANLEGLAIKANCEIHYTSDINSESVIEKLRKIGPDLCLIVGWSQICNSEFRSIAKLGNIGFHPAPLPRFRGRAVIPWIILQGEETSGSTLFWLDDGIDSGPILMQRLFSIEPDETAQSLYSKNVDNLRHMLPEAIKLIAYGSPPRIAQNASEASYCAKRTPEDGLIDWRSDVQTILRFIRAVGHPYPGAFTYYKGEKFFIDVATSIKDSQKYIGLTGQVQSHTSSGFTVRCGDANLIEVLTWRSMSSLKPRLHAKFMETHN
jgi:methionyl-tRNA formyltransferase